MSSNIGQAAGQLWEFLEKNGVSSPSKIEKETKLSRTDLQRAIGWLAKEDKLIIEHNGRVETLSLK
jgi:hypothetical protein